MRLAAKAASCTEGVEFLKNAFFKKDTASKVAAAFTLRGERCVWLRRDTVFCCLLAYLVLKVVLGSWPMQAGMAGKAGCKSGLRKECLFETRRREECVAEGAGWVVGVGGWVFESHMQNKGESRSRRSDDAVMHLRNVYACVTNIYALPEVGCCRQPRVAWIHASPKRHACEHQHVVVTLTHQLDQACCFPGRCCTCFPRSLCLCL